MRRSIHYLDTVEFPELQALRGLPCFGYSIREDWFWLWRSKPGYRKALRILRRSRLRRRWRVVLTRPVYIAKVRLGP